jgi:hypothetical protein
MSGDFVLVVDRDGNQAFVVADASRDVIDFACMVSPPVLRFKDSVEYLYDAVATIRRFVRQRWRCCTVSELTDTALITEWPVFVEDDAEIAKDAASAWSIDAWLNRTRGPEYLREKWRQE